MNQEENQYVRQLEEEYEDLRNNTKNINQGMQGVMSAYNTENEENLIKWQLDLKQDLEDIYHLLRGDIKVEDEKGNEFYKEAEDPDLRTFNEFGVQLVMNIMKFYLNRNTILSNYKEDVIEWKVYDFGIRISDLVHNKYEDMMTTIEQEEDESEKDFAKRREEHLAEKLKLYPLIVGELVDTVHSAYLRAYRGGERESLRKVMSVTQNETPNRIPGSPGNYFPQMKRKKFLGVF